jgi:pyruvate ferredoxin oxidoreductase gamma subunit
MSEVLEIRWHGRGGQGAKLAALLFGEAALETGKYIQAFPEYGPERMGAPVAAYNRLADEPIQIHSGIKFPKIVIVLDPSLIKSARALKGLKPDGGILLVNTKDNPKALKQELGLGDTKVDVYTVDATQIALDTIKQARPNTPMLGALVKVVGILDFKSVIEAIEDKLKVKLRNKEKLIAANVEAVKRAYNEVRSARDVVEECVPRAFCTQNPDECETVEVKATPATWKDLPVGAHLRDPKKVRENKTGAWRSMRPHWNAEKCNNCLNCWVFCPDAAIIMKDGKVSGIDLDYCKGCGICAQVCPKKVNAITMSQEEK